MNIYRIKLFTQKSGEHSESKHREYCLENNLFAIGWPITDITEISEYEKNCYTKYGSYHGFKVSYKNLRQIQLNDLVWTQQDGRTYLLGKIKSDIYIDNNQPDMGPVRSVEQWKKIEFDDVPGKIISSFVGIGTTLQRIRVDNNFKEYCKWLYEDKTYQLNKSFFDYRALLHSDDLEDLLGLYLQKELKYYIIPSTNKQGTKLIEYELVRDDGTKACVQCKIGNSKVDDTIFQEFKDYNKIYITTMNDESYDRNGSNVQTIRLKTLEEWAMNNKEILPQRIQNYIFAF